MSGIRDEVEAAFPGIELKSEIQGYAFLERFADGVERYKALSSPSPDDDRWAGVCFYQLLRDDEALIALERAAARGQPAARINKAHLLPFLERGDEAVIELQQVDFQTLSAYDKALYLRVLSLQAENSGNLREALRAAEDAWNRIQGIAEYKVLAPSILVQLAILYARIGRSQRALWFVERSMPTTEGTERHKIRLRRAAVLIALGRFQEAILELESRDFIDAPETHNVERTCLFGQIALAQGNPREAIRKYNQAVEMASRLNGFGYEEFLSRLALVSILGSRGEFAAATEHITRAQELISDKADRLSFRFREVLLMLWQGRYTQAHAAEELQGLIHAFGEMGLLQEQAAVTVHLADLYRVTGRDFSGLLDELQTLSITLQNPSLVARELALLPALKAVVEKTHPRIAGTRTSTLEVHTLGEESVVLDGKPVHIPLKRGVEVLAYLLERKAVTLQDVIDDVFPNEKVSSAKSYFHQFRHQLREHVDGLAIEYESEAKMYRLSSEINVIWDVAEVRAGREVPGIGRFLPGSRNEWARRVDEELDAYRKEPSAARSVTTA